MYIGALPAGGQECQRISSIYIYSPDRAGFIEFGWVIGWSTCSGMYANYARPFWVSQKRTTGARTCSMFSDPPNLPEGTYQQFRLSDTNANGHWNMHYNGSHLGNDADLDFAFGWNYLGRERGEPEDSGYARWQSIEEYKYSDGWTRWDDGTCLTALDNDPGYNCHRENAYTISSQAN